jgi:hypothetical protein
MKDMQVTTSISQLRLEKEHLFFRTKIFQNLINSSKRKKHIIHKQKPITSDIL